MERLAPPGSRRLAALQAHRPEGERWAVVALLGPCVALLTIGLLLPLLELARRSVWQSGFTASFLHEVARPPYSLVLGNTIVVSAMVAVAATIVAYPFAVGLVLSTGHWRRALLLCVYLPLLTGVLVRSLCWIILLQRNGMLNWLLMRGGLPRPLDLVYNRTGVLVGMTHVLLPFAVLACWASLMRIDRQVAWAARSLGARPWMVWSRILLPLSLDGIVGGFFLVFVLAMGFYITPALLGGPGDLMISQLVSEQISRFGNINVAAAVSLLLALVVGAIAVGFSFLSRFLRAEPG